MNPPLLILISGPPAAGKTTLGKRLSQEFRLPFLSKDDIKERLFDTLGWSDRVWSRKLGIAGMALLFDFVERHLEVGRSVIVESNFDPVYDTATVAALAEKYAVRVLEVHCVADSAVLLARYQERECSGARHPGHRGGTPQDECDRALGEALASRKWKPVAPSGQVLTVDTTDPATVNFAPLRQVLQDRLKGQDERT